MCVCVCVSVEIGPRRGHGFGRFNFVARFVTKSLRFRGEDLNPGRQEPATAKVKTRCRHGEVDLTVAS